MARGLLGFRAVKVTLEEFSRVLAALHEAAADPQGWEAPIAGAMRLLGASKGAILDVDASGLAGVVALGHDPAAQKAYTEHYFAVDPTVPACLAAPPHEPLTVYEQFPAGARRGGEYFDFARRVADIGDALGIGTRGEHGRRAVLSFQQPAQGAGFDLEAKQLMSLLAPHLEIAKRAQARLAESASARAALAAGIDRFTDAAYILDGHARIRHLNRAGAALLARERRVRSAGGRLALAEPRGQAAFEAAVRAAAGKAARCTLLPLPRTDGLQAAEVVISPLHAQHALVADWQLPLALVVIGLARHDARSIAARMRALYGLTPAEARVVALLAMGATVRDIAHANQVREVTVRSQLRSIAHKTGAGRQADLVRLALGGAGISLE